MTISEWYELVFFCFALLVFLVLIAFIIVDHLKKSGYL
jgi:hypothetical protein